VIENSEIFIKSISIIPIAIVIAIFIILILMRSEKLNK
jgi:hypothetical protein